LGDGFEHDLPDTGIIVLEEFHHKFRTHLSAGLAPADIAAVDADGLHRGDEANAVVGMMNVAADIIIAGLLLAMEAA